MSQFPGTRRRLLTALAGCALLAGAAAAPAGAVGYGEVGQPFGSPGSGQGQFTVTSMTSAFGVDPTDDSVYVGDEPKAGEYRIQKFSSQGTFLATVSFTPPPIQRISGLEGIAVDTSLKRIYVLAVGIRPESTETKEFIDKELPVAGILYAFKTEAEGSKLVPAENQFPGEPGVFAKFRSETNEAHVALLEPSGIAVDPKTNDVIVMGSEDLSEGKENEELELRVAFQRVKSKGHIEESRYVDKKENPVFGPEGEFPEPSSPIVTQTGRIYVESFNQIVEVPSQFTSTEAPKSFIQFDPTLQQELLAFPSDPRPSEGGGLSYIATGATEGRIYAYSGVAQQKEEHGKISFSSKYPGALAFKYAENGGSVEGAEIGWTGGQPKTEPKCTIGFNKPPTVAAGGSEMVFMFDAAAARVVEFGPGGSGCASATATAPQATVSGKPVSVVPVGTKVTLSSTVTQANALSVEWEFGDGTKAETVSTPEYQNTTVEHAFAQGGKLTIKETIHTDNLTTPTLTEEGTINVTAPPPTALFSVRTAVTVGEAVGFDGTASHPNGAPSLKEYRWKFGDGSEATTKTAETTHSYAQAGEYTVELVVVDSLSQSSEAYTQQIKVNPPVLPPPVEKQPPPVEKQAPPPPPPPPPPVPDAELASSLLTSSPSGAVGVKLTCPAGESSCSGTVTLRTLGAVSARSGGRSKKKGKAAILTLATGSFTVAGGQVASVTLHLSAKARALLARLHSLRAQATIVAHDPAGAAHTTQTIVTLRAPKAAHRRGHQHH